MGAFLAPQGPGQRVVTLQLLPLAGEGTTLWTKHHCPGLSRLRPGGLSLPRKWLSWSLGASVQGIQCDNAEWQRTCGGRPGHSGKIFVTHLHVATCPSCEDQEFPWGLLGTSGLEPNYSIKTRSPWLQMKGGLPVCKQGGLMPSHPCFRAELGSK